MNLLYPVFIDDVSYLSPARAASRYMSGDPEAKFYSSDQSIGRDASKDGSTHT